jgi:hypothetical protein
MGLSHRAAPGATVVLHPAAPEEFDTGPRRRSSTPGHGCAAPTGRGTPRGHGFVDEAGKLATSGGHRDTSRWKKNSPNVFVFLLVVGWSCKAHVSVVVYMALPFCSTGLRVDSKEDEEFFCKNSVFARS